MSMLSQYYDYTEIGEHTKLQLFSDAYRHFHGSLYQYDPDPEVREAMEVYSRESEDRYIIYCQIFQTLGIYDEYQKSIEIDVMTALERGISYKEAHDARIFAKEIS